MKKLFATLALSLSAPAFAFNCYDIPLPDGVSLSELESCIIESGLAVVVDENEKYGYINTKGTIAIAPKFDKAWAFQDGLAVVQLDGKWGYIRPNGSFAIKPIYDEAWGFSDGLGKVQKDNKVGFVNHKGHFVIPMQYDNSYHWFDDNLSAISKNQKWAIVNHKGKLITAFDYDYATSPSGERILIGKKQKDGTLKYGFLDTKGKQVIAPQYDEAEEFNHGIALVTKDDETYYINKKGETVDVKINLAQ